MTQAYSQDHRFEEGITRADQPIEDDEPTSVGIVAAERKHEADIEAGREQIGTTRGNQPIETVAHDRP